MSESFDPTNEKYKSVADLPEDKREDFVDVEGGFVGKEAKDEMNDAEKLAAIANIINEKKISGVDVLHQDALDEAENAQVMKEKILSYISGDVDDYDSWSKAHEALLELFPTMPETLRNDRELIYEVVKKKHGDIIEFASNELKDDKDFVLKLISTGFIYSEDMSERLRNDKEIILAGTKVSIDSAKAYRLKIGREKEEVYALDFFSYASEELRNDKEFAIQIIRMGAAILGVCPDSLKDDKDVVLESVKVKDNETIVRFASARLRNDLDVALEVVKNNPESLQYLSKEVQEKVNKLLE